MLDAGAHRGAVLTVSHYFDSHRGGVELVAAALARQLATQGFRCSWLATGAAPAASSSVRTVAIGANNILERRTGIPFPLPGPAGVARIVREVRAADVVLLHDALYPTSVAAFLAARAFRKPVAVVQHIGPVPYRSPVLRWVQALANALVTRPLLARADQVVFISETTQRFFSRVKFRRPALRIFNGVDAALFRPARDSEEVAARRATLRLPANAPIAAFVGRFVEKKGLHLVEAVARLRPDVAFVLAGWGPIDPSSWGLPNVHLRRDLGPADIADLYQASDLLLLPSVGEGLPLVMQEALAAGLPVVCGEQTALADAHATTLLLGVDVSQPVTAAAAALACAMDRALADNTSDRRARRRAFALERYSWEAAGARYGSMIDALREARQRPFLADLVEAPA